MSITGKFKALIVCLSLAGSMCWAQEKTSFVYDVKFDYNFDNREFDAGGNAFTPSKTLNSARLTPSLGVSCRQGKRFVHTVMAGIDIMRNMGESPTAATGNQLDNAGLFRELTLWYGIDASLRKSRIKAYAGMFPRSNSVFGKLDTPYRSLPGRDIPSAFLSDEYRFYDNNMEGVLITAQRRRSYYEIGLDWLGMYGSLRREQFIVTSYGKTALVPWLHAGWAASIHHYANAVEYGGVVDDILVSPFLSLDVNRLAGLRLQSLSLTASYLQGIHQDRKRNTGLKATCGGQLTLDVRQWNVGIRNECYCGMDQYPFWAVASPEGTPYAADLYRGNPFYRVSTDGSISCYDRCEVYWQPRLAAFLDLRISLAAHFAEGAFQGWQQKLSLP